MKAPISGAAAGEDAGALAADVPFRRAGTKGLLAAIRNAGGRLHSSDDIWYVVAATVVNVANFAFFGLVGHLLRPSAYGAVATLLNLVSIAAIPLNALQAAVVQETVLQSRDGAVPSVRRAAVVFAAASLLVTAVVAGLSPVAAGFFGLSSVVPVLLLAIWFAPAISSSLYDGVLIGTLRWRPIAISLIAGAVVRVAVALVLGLLDPNVDGPVLATVLNAVVTLGVVLYAIREHSDVPDRRRLALPLRGMLPTVAALAGYSVLVALDTLLARHILTPTQSGNYAAAVTLGRIALFLPMTVTTVVFPRLVADAGRPERFHRLLMFSLGGVLTLGLVSAAVLAAGARIAVTILFGHRYTQAPSLIGLLSLEGAILGGVGLLTYSHLARRSWFAVTPVLTTVAVSAFVLAARPAPHPLARTMILATTVCLILMVLGTFRGRSASTDGLGEQTG